MDNDNGDNDDNTWVGFADKTWQVHKFGGTSVAHADCFRAAAKIVEDQLGVTVQQDSNGNSSSNSSHSTATTTTTHPHNFAVVVSAMGGKPKVTDLLLNSVTAAAKRDLDQVERILQLLLDKHATCLEDLFDTETKDTFMGVIQKDLEDIRDILKTVALMKWEASRISELVSGYGEVWSAQILTRLLQQRTRQRNEHQLSLLVQEEEEEEEETTVVHHEFVYLDARRVIIIDEDAIQDGSVCWDLSKSKLNSVHDTEWAKLQLQHNTTNARQKQQIIIRMHFCITGFVASNTHGVATTLQRDGSDYSAAIMGRLLQSINITIWTDVDGVLSADPRRVPLAGALPEISFNEAMELAYFGAKVRYVSNILFILYPVISGCWLIWNFFATQHK
jgi:aspartokinase/homoserine dehydrogenase 1